MVILSKSFKTLLIILSLTSVSFLSSAKNYIDDGKNKGKNGGPEYCARVTFTNPVHVAGSGFVPIHYLDINMINDCNEPVRFDLFDEYAGGRHVQFATYHLKPHSTWNIQRELKKQKG